MAMKSPVATDKSADRRIIRDELVPARVRRVTQFRHTYEAADRDQSKARLTVRRKQADARREVPASGSAYVDARTIRLLPEGTNPIRAALRVPLSATAPKVSASATQRRAT